MKNPNHLSRRQLLAAPVMLAAGSERPNFIVILADDLGYGDLGCYGSAEIRTPRLDGMAREGMRFTNFLAQPICGPSRCALMTGCYPQRVAERGNVKNIHPVLHEKEITLGQVLQRQGYATAMIGKWDLAGHSNVAFQPDLMPQKRGFDLHYGTPTSNDSVQNTILVRDGEVIEKPADQATLTGRYFDEAIRFLQGNKERPVFIYLCPNMPHTALHASAGFRGKSKRGLYGDVVEELDWNVGRLLDEVRRLGLAEKTYVLFTSDNGPWLMKKEEGGSAGRLRSGKVSCWEGGFRVPCIAWGPGRVGAGRVQKELAATVDVLPTLAELAGVETPRDRVLDGVSMAPLLVGGAGAKSKRSEYYYYLWTHLQAVRKGRWKLHLPRPAKPEWLRPLIDTPHIAEEDRIEAREPLLFDLESDEGERRDVAGKNRAVVKELLALAEKARADIGDYDRVGANTRFFDAMEKRPERPVRVPRGPVK